MARFSCPLPCPVAQFIHALPGFPNLQPGGHKAFVVTAILWMPLEALVSEKQEQQRLIIVTLSLLEGAQCALLLERPC